MGTLTLDTKAKPEQNKHKETITKKSQTCPPIQGTKMLCLSSAVVFFTNTEEKRPLSFLSARLTNEGTE